MKKQILILFLLPTLSYSQYNEKYKEFNCGVITDIFFDGNEIWPGASFLLGKSHYYNNNTILDYQAGLAFPTIVTGKVGFGIGDIDFATIIGVRAYPPTAYIQFSNNQRFNFSAEYLLDEDIFGQSLIITYGIRFY